MTLVTCKSHNILVVGGHHSDRLEHAKMLASYHLCQNRLSEKACYSCNDCQRVSSLSHPNLICIEPETKDEKGNSQNQNNEEGSGVIKIDQARRIIQENHKANFEKGMSIFVITHMHRVTKGAANALLKVIEENNAKKMFIVLSPSRMAILSTIASRLICHHIKPNPLSYEIKEELRNKIMTISQTKPSARFPLCEQFSHDRDGFLEELDEMVNICHILVRQGSIFPRFALLLLEAFYKAQKNLRKNLNPRLVAEVLLFHEWPFV